MNTFQFLSKRMKLKDRYTIIFITLGLACSVLVVITLYSLQNRRTHQIAVLMNDLEFIKNVHRRKLENNDAIQGNVSQSVESERTATITYSEQEISTSDAIPLNRNIPDSRPIGCKDVSLNVGNQSVSIIIVIQDEMPSVLLRTLYSIITRTSLTLLKDIIIIDDASNTGFIKNDLNRCVEELFDEKLIKIIRVDKSIGEVAARQMGVNHSSGDVLVFLESCMEVNVQWLEPLLIELNHDVNVVAVSNTDTITSSFEYTWNEEEWSQLYGFDWSLSVFRTFHRSQELSSNPSSPYRGVVMKGSSFAAHKEFFQRIGGFDTKMNINGKVQYLEFSWKIWLCGGQLRHVPCSKIGHLQREKWTFPPQAYYKRAADTWVEEGVKEFVYDFYTKMKTENDGKIENPIKEKCHPFKWLIDTVWPELFIYNQNVTAWGSLQNYLTSRCLDNHGYLLEKPGDLFAEVCHYKYLTQGFSLTTNGLLRTTLHCVVVAEYSTGSRPVLRPCSHLSTNEWKHEKRKTVQHVPSKLCLDLDEWGPIMKDCKADKLTQQWMFTKYID